MTSIFAVFALLCICLYMQAPAQAALTKLVEVKRDDLGDKFRLTAIFEPVSDDVEAVWWLHKDDMSEKPQTGTTLTPGKTTLELAKASFNEHVVYLELGDLKGQYLHMVWNVGGKGNLESRLDLPMATVVPGTDLVHAPNSPVTMSISVKDGRGHGVVSFYNDAEFYSHVYLDKATNEVLTPESSAFLTKSSTTAGGVTKSTVTFAAKDGETINGYFPAAFEGFTPVGDNSSPVHSVTEMIIVKVHPQGHNGPFPNDFISASFYETNDHLDCHGYWKYHMCKIYCIAFGNDIKAIEIFKINTSTGQREKQATKSYPGTPFKETAIHEVNAESDGELGKYVCSAQLQDGTKSENTITVAA